MTIQGAALKPLVPEKGDVWLMPVTDIFAMHSVDYAAPGEWEDLLYDKRLDWTYGEILDSIESRGFVRPLAVGPCYYSDGANELMFGDGHHRLAAAIDLGYKHIPVMFVPDVDRYISEDSGGWHEGAPIQNMQEYLESPNDWSD